MPVSFNSIPANWKMPLYWVEVDPSMAGYPRSRLTSLLFGLMSADGTALPNVPIPVPSQADARQLFGYGSMLDGMVESFTNNNFAQELWVRYNVELEGVDVWQRLLDQGTDPVTGPDRHRRFIHDYGARL